MTAIFSSSCIYTFPLAVFHYISMSYMEHVSLIYISKWTHCCDVPCITFTTVMIKFYVITYLTFATTMLVVSDNYIAELTLLYIL